MVESARTVREAQLAMPPSTDWLLVIANGIIGLWDWALAAVLFLLSWEASSRGPLEKSWGHPVFMLIPSLLLVGGILCWLAIVFRLATRRLTLISALITFVPVVWFCGLAGCYHAELLLLMALASVLVYTSYYCLILVRTISGLIRNGSRDTDWLLVIANGLKGFLDLALCLGLFAMLRYYALPVAGRVPLEGTWGHPVFVRPVMDLKPASVMPPLLLVNGIVCWLAIFIKRATGYLTLVSAVLTPLPVFLFWYCSFVVTFQSRQFPEAPFVLCIFAISVLIYPTYYCLILARAILWLIRRMIPREVK